MLMLLHTRRTTYTQSPAGAGDAFQTERQKSVRRRLLTRSLAAYERQIWCHQTKSVKTPQAFIIYRWRESLYEHWADAQKRPYDTANHVRSCVNYPHRKTDFQFRAAGCWLLSASVQLWLAVGGNVHRSVWISRFQCSMMKPILDCGQPLNIWIVLPGCSIRNKYPDFVAWLRIIITLAIGDAWGWFCSNHGISQHLGLTAVVKPPPLITWERQNSTKDWQAASGGHVVKLTVWCHKLHTRYYWICCDIVYQHAMKNTA